MGTGTLLRVSDLSLPLGSFIYTVLPIGGPLAAISSDDSLRIFDQASLGLVQAIEKAHEGITCLEYLSGTANTLCLTAGRDAAVRCWDTRLGNKTLQLRHGMRSLSASSIFWISMVQRSSSSADASTALLSLAAAGNLIAVGSELSQSQASVTVWYSMTWCPPVG